MKITGKEGTYYNISCEKCGAKMVKNRVYFTRYGNVYHCNPALKCDQCGFSVKFISDGSDSSFSTKTIHFNKNAEIPSENLNSTPSQERAKEKDVNSEAIENCPKFIKHRIDVKAETIHAINNTLKKLTQGQIIPENVKTMIVTNFGIVEGTVKEKLDIQDVTYRIFFDSFKIRNHDLFKLEKEWAHPLITNNDSFITICDAKIIPFSNPSSIVTVAALNLFSDQIVGFACGEYQ